MPEVTLAEIPRQQAPATDQRLVFSFKYLHDQNPNFALANCSLAFFLDLFKALQRYSSSTLEEFIDQNNNEHRHIIWFPETSEPEGFNHLDADQLAYHEAWQFCVRTDRSWRVHGMLIENVFFVVWLDPNHRLYPVRPNEG